MKFRIAVDVMGGDNPPCELARGAISAGSEFGVDIILVGTESARNEIGELPEGVTFLLAESEVLMEDAPSSVMKDKSDSSLALAVGLCKNGEADAVVSAANTGALFTCASLVLRRIRGVRRAAICSVIPLEKPLVLLDCGANTDATPDVLLIYARMGSIYASNVMGIASPRVGLLNNGTEPQKGTNLYTEAYKLLENEKSINFIGNCEGKTIPFGVCDVLVCDGFTGNITLKLIEGMADFMSKSIKELFAKNTATMLSGMLVKKQLKGMKKRLDPKEYGGAPLLGLTKPVIKAHGSSDAYAMRSAVRQAVNYLENGTVSVIEAALAEES